MRYDVTALFDKPVFGQISRATLDNAAEHVFSDRSPESAARKWLHMLSPAEREATVRLIVSAPVTDGYRPYPIYKGPDIEFERLNGRLSRVA
jgi:hypothetical protein